MVTAYNATNSNNNKSAAQDMVVYCSALSDRSVAALAVCLAPYIRNFQVYRGGNANAKQLVKNATLAYSKYFIGLDLFESKALLGELVAYNAKHWIANSSNYRNSVIGLADMGFREEKTGNRRPYSLEALVEFIRYMKSGDFAFSNFGLFNSNGIIALPKLKDFGGMERNVSDGIEASSDEIAAVAYRLTKCIKKHGFANSTELLIVAAQLYNKSMLEWDGGFVGFIDEYISQNGANYDKLEKFSSTRIFEAADRQRKSLENSGNELPESNATYAFNRLIKKLDRDSDEYIDVIKLATSIASVKLGEKLSVVKGSNGVRLSGTSINGDTRSIYLERLSLHATKLGNGFADAEEAAIKC
ncbi:MAG: hypothetical protein QXN59_02825, partial [Candidatus Micrarchaeaceae archaeon]